MGAESEAGAAGVAGVGGALVFFAAFIRLVRMGRGALGSAEGAAVGFARCAGFCRGTGFVWVGTAAGAGLEGAESSDVVDAVALGLSRCAGFILAEELVPSL